MTRELIQKYIKSVGVDMVETASLLGVSVPTIRNALKFPSRLSENMWLKLEKKLKDIYEL